MIKKIHSVLTLAICAVLLAHMVATGLLMTQIVPMSHLFPALAHTLMTLFVIHLLLTFIPMMLNHDGNRERPYTRLNAGCYAQRISGLLIIAFLHPHLKAFIVPSSKVAKTPLAENLADLAANPNAIAPVAQHVTMASLFHFIAMVSLIVFCCLHVSLSIPKALVGLGIIVEEKPLAIVQKICFVCVFAIGVFAILCTAHMAALSGLFGGGI